MNEREVKLTAGEASDQSPLAAPGGEDELEALRELMADFRLSNWTDDFGDGLPLVDRITSGGDIGAGMQQLEMLADEIACFYAGRAALPAQGWMAMIYAPLDGTEVELLLHHPNHRYAKGEEKRQWEQVVRAQWIDFNGGGWCWRGMSGTPMGWRAAPPSVPQQEKKQ